MDMDNGKWQIQNSYFAPFLSTQGISRLNVRGTTTSSSKVAPKQEKIKYDEECWKRLDSNKAEHANNSPALHQQFSSWWRTNCGQNYICLENI